MFTTQTKLIHELVAGGREQPCARVVERAEVSPTAQRFEKQLLHEVIGVFVCR